MLSYQHCTALRWLLIVSGDVELNPGPVNYQTLNSAALRAIANVVFEGVDEVDDIVALKKEELIAILQKQNQAFVSWAVQQVTGSVSQSQGQQKEASTGKVAKLPVFYEQDTRKWFEQVEEILTTECSTEQQYKTSLLRVLNTETLKLAGVDASSSYEEIKQCILKHFDETQEQKLRKMLSQVSLGDQKPSTVMRQMLELAAGNEDVVKLKFMEILPEQIRLTLAGLSFRMSLRDMADIADRMIEQMPQNSKVSAVETSQSSEEIKLLKEQVAELTRAVQAIAVSGNSDRSFQRGRSPYRGPWNRARNQSRSHSRGRYNPRGRYCFYHFEFGKRATKCADGCKWSSNPSENGGTPP